jgi:hypothetical protein
MYLHTHDRQLLYAENVGELQGLAHVQHSKLVGTCLHVALKQLALL